MRLVFSGFGAAVSRAPGYGGCWDDDVVEYLRQTRVLYGCPTDDLKAICTTRLVGQDSFAVVNFKSLQAGSASYLACPGVQQARSAVV